MNKPSDWTDLWERDDSKSLAPLSATQIDFVESLISLNKKETICDIENESIDANDQDPEHNYKNLLNFHKYFIKIDNEMQCQTDSRLSNINQYHMKCQQLNTILDQVLTHLKTLDNEYCSALSKTRSFYNSCDTLIQQQHGLIVAIEALNEKLSYFEELETMSKKFSSPTMLTLNESLVPLLSRLDECINFMTHNESNYLEASSYLQEYRRFQSSAMNTIRTHVINTLKQTATQVMPENETVLTPNDSVFTLYYGKFQTNAHRIKTLMQQLEHRTNQSELYSQYLDDCHQCYFEIRESLIGSVLTLAMEEMINSSGRNFCSLIRSSAKLYIQICRDEYQLYFQFFTQMNSTLIDFLDRLCSSLYDKLRPIVIHLEHLESLSEICALIKSEFIDENVHQDDLESFVKTMEQLLQDTQERLVYRCNIYIQTNILNYTPASGDLAYPEKLEMMKSITENLIGDNQDEPLRPMRNRSDSVSSIISSISDISFVQGANYQNESRKVSSRSVTDLHGMWYPTVRSTIMCLSKLYRSLDKQTFQGLSQDVLFACIDSLEVAHTQIKQRKTLIDGYLFIIKYLLIIREQIIPFHIETSIKEVYLDFTKTKSAVIELLQKRANLFTLTSNNALLKLMFEGTPQVSEKTIDSQKAVDIKIKEKCEEFISYIYEYLTSDMKNFILASKLPKLTGMESVSTAGQLPQETDLVEQYRLKLKETLQSFQTKKQSIEKSMSLYLSNAETEAIIFKQVKTKIQTLYEQLVKILLNKFPTDSDRIKLEIPPLRLLLSSSPQE
ncbi:hypothetical protein RDWZM_009045 [Blomia tropicalis]|uniref:Conserved oligomeric Golgi complex subunit 3 n=1 Tax=Blomia tropicalis TaxID=40697 RepID=A0A9Q0M386_BLOTA|nr:Golgi transport complex subunit 3 [Blomia tropicalis]KAJ6217888.1 hypothetical protein RDWZM_009045 [Blomia tropicalis]